MERQKRKGLMVKRRRKGEWRSRMGEMEACGIASCIALLLVGAEGEEDAESNEEEEEKKKNDEEDDEDEEEEEKEEEEEEEEEVGVVPGGRRSCGMVREAGMWRCKRSLARRNSISS